LGFILLPIFIEMPVFLHLWLKNVPEYTVIFCRLLLIDSLIAALIGNLGNAINAVGEIRKFQIFSSIFNISTIILTIIFFKLGFSPYFLYISCINFTILHFFKNLYFSKKHFNLSYNYFYSEIISKCFIVVILTILTTLVPYFIIENYLIKFYVVMFISIVSFIAYSWIFALNIREKKQIKISVIKIQKFLIAKILNHINYI
jgi:hypothetical protein